MTWDEIRIHYIDRLAASGRTQTEVAAAGHLSGQNAISKLIGNAKRGPSVDTFIKAILGLGESPAAFFAGLDTAMTTSPSSVLARLHALESALTTLDQPRRSHAPSASYALDSTAVDALVALVFERIAARLHVRAHHPGAPESAGALAPADPPHDHLDSPPATVRRAHRRRVRKPARRAGKG